MVPAGNDEEWKGALLAVSCWRYCEELKEGHSEPKWRGRKMMERTGPCPRYSKAVAQMEERRMRRALNLVAVWRTQYMKPDVEKQNQRLFCLCD